MAKLEIWDKLSKTDPKHTKSFKRAGGFSGTAVSPIYMTRKMTEAFGPAGQGWGMGQPSFQTVDGPEGEVLVYCTVAVWWELADQIVYGVGGDKAVGKNKYGLFTDDEAFKKAYTDALSNAMKQLGMAADIHMGMYDDNKYVNALKEEFSDKPATVQSAVGAAFKEEQAKNAPDPDVTLMDWKAFDYTRTRAQTESRALSVLIHDDKRTPDEATLDAHIADHQSLIEAIMQCSTWWDNIEDRIKERRDVLRQCDAENLHPQETE